MKTLPCPDCGRAIRPCNLRRHRASKHVPRRSRTPYGSKFDAPPMPIRVGKSRDRRYDEIAPRGPGPERFRIYRLRAGELELLATAGSPEAFGIGLMTLWTDGEFVGDDSVGVLDTAEDPGHWIVSPFTLGRKPIDEGVGP
jgi:hypothetical protein